MFTLRRNDMTIDIDHHCPLTESPPASTEVLPIISHMSSTHPSSPTNGVPSTVSTFRPSLTLHYHLPLYVIMQTDDPTRSLSSSMSPSLAANPPSTPILDVAPATDPFKRGPLLTRPLLDEAWRIIKCARSDEDTYTSLLAPADRIQLTSTITHLRVEQCTRPVAFSALSRVLPQLAVLEIRGGIIRHGQTSSFRAPKLRSLVIWGCKFDALSVGSMLTGSPHLTSLAIGGMADSQLCYLQGRVVHGPRLGQHLRWLFLDITRPALTNCTMNWVRNTQDQVPLHTLRVVLGECALITFVNLLGVFNISLQILDIYCKEKKWDIDPREPILLCFDSLSNIQRIRLTFHHPLLKALVVKLLDMGSAARNLLSISLAVIFGAEQADLSILDELDVAFNRGAYPALELVSFTMLLDRDDDMRNSDNPDTADVLMNMYHATVRNALASIDRRGLLEIRVRHLVFHEFSFLEPRTPRCTIGM